MTGEVVLTALVALILAVVHVFGSRMRFLRSTPRSVWLSAAGGVSVSYVFVHLLPELAAYQETFRQRLDGAGVLGAIESHSYVIALAGLAIFYGLDRMVRTSAIEQARTGGERCPSNGAFWIHLCSFALYNVLVGYLLLHREETDLRGLVVYAVAMSLHFVVNDQGLREHHGQLYDARGRWLLAAAPLLGWGMGLATKLPPLAVSALFAFLAGGVVMNVLREELPEDRESRFSAFLGGAIVYSALLLMTR